MKPLVYIILVNYNGAKDTIECVKSLEQITYNNYRVLIIDNNSTDDSVKILKKNINSKHIIIESKENNGFSAGNNIGIKIALEDKADYVLLLNNDTVVDKRFLEPLIESFNSNVGITIGKIYYTKEKNKIWYDGGNINFKTAKIRHFNYDKYDTKMYADEMEITFATGCCMLISSEVIKKVGMLSEDYFLYYEDTDYCCKVIKNNYKIIYNPNSIIYHSVSSSTNKISNLLQYYMIRNKLIFIKKNISNRNKLIALLYFFIELIYKIINQNINIKIAFRAINDYRNNRFGKV